MAYSSFTLNHKYQAHGGATEKVMRTQQSIRLLLVQFIRVQSGGPIFCAAAGTSKNS